MTKNNQLVQLPIIESYWVENGRFLAGEYPGGYDLLTTRYRMDAFLEAGINTFIDLTQKRELTSYERILNEQAQMLNINVAYHRFEIRDHGIPSHSLMPTILNTIDNALETGRNIYVHCWGGIGRTGIVVGCYFVRHGMASEQAVLQVNKLYKTRPNNYEFPRSPETTQQVDFILNWHENKQDIPAHIVNDANKREV